MVEGFFSFLGFWDGNADPTPPRNCLRSTRAPIGICRMWLLHRAVEGSWNSESTFLSIQVKKGSRESILMISRNSLTTKNVCAAESLWPLEPRDAVWPWRTGCPWAARERPRREAGPGKHVTSRGTIQLVAQPPASNLPQVHERGVRLRHNRGLPASSVRRTVDQASELASGTSPHAVVEQSMYGFEMANLVFPKAGIPHKGSAVFAGAEHSTGPALRKNVSRNLVKEIC